MFLSACIELLFAEDLAFPERIRAAAAAGLSGIEFWGWRTKNISAIAAAAQSTGITITSFLADPPGRLTDRTTHAGFLQALPESIALARQLGTTNLIVLAGDRLTDVSTADQRQAITDVLREAAELAAPYDVTLVLEPLNTRVDHPGYFLDATDVALAIIEDVSSPRLLLLYDVYHSVTMGEDVGRVVADAGALIGHVHLADVPGRHEPGNGLIDWQSTLDALANCRYDGPVGLEYRPTTDSAESLRVIREALANQEGRASDSRATPPIVTQGRTLR